MEKEEAAAAVMEEVIYVAVGRETAKNKSNLTWAIDNSQGNKICIVLVHQPPHMIPVHAEKLCVEMDSIEKGIVKMIHENKVRKLIMGATADKHYSTKGRMDEVRALSALLSDFQRLVSSRSSSNSDMLSGSSKAKSEVEEEEGTSRTSSSRSVGTLSYSGGSEASPSVTEDKSNHSSPPPSLPCTGMGLGMISILIHSTKLWHKRAIQNHKLCE
ncbi:hypothetical protein Bca4012_095823 [Brassica carinata]